MFIDWFTVGAQLLNFIVLIWLMKRFLYLPILNAIDTREKLIAEKIADADANKAKAQIERDDFAKKNEEFDQQRATLLKQATDEAKAERQRLVEEARQAAEILSNKRKEALKKEAEKLNQSIIQRTQQEVFAIAQKALADLATTSLEERLSDVFIRRLHEIDEATKKLLSQAIKASSAPAKVLSAFALPDAQRAMIQKALNETFSADIKLRFETSPDLVSGIEFTTNGQKVAWSIADYLESMKNSLPKG